MSQRSSGTERGGELRLLPYLLVRIAGGPFTAFSALEASETAEKLAQARRLEEELESLGQALSRDLYEAVGAMADDGLRRDLLALRRALFAGRRPRGEWVEAAAAALPEAAAERLLRLVEGRVRQAELTAEATRLYAEECERSGERLRELARDPLLRRGLAISSSSLLRAVDEYLLAAPDAMRRARVRRAELGLVKYLARFHCKTSPLSTLTSVSVVEIPGEGGGRLRLHGSAPAQSRVRLNNALCAYLKDRLRILPGVRRRLPVALARSCRRSGDAYAVVANVRNVDLFQTLRPSDAIDTAVEVSTSLRPGAVWDDLLDVLERRLEVEGGRDDLQQFLEQLVDCGLLEVGLRTPALDADWEVALLHELEDLGADDPVVEEIRDLLRALHRARHAFAAADATSRRQSMETMAARIREVQDRLETASAGGAAVGRRHRAPRLELSSESVLYEDSVIPARAELDPSELEPLVRALADLNAEVRRVSWRLSPRLDLLRFVRERYGESARVPLLELCEQRHARAEAPVGGLEGEPAEPRSPWTWSTFLDRLPPEALAAEELALSLADVREAAAGEREERVEEGARSDGAFLHLLPPTDGGRPLRAVISFWCPGSGKMLGRFLRDGEPVLEVLRQENRRLAGDRLFAEIRDGSSHAANVHPPLMPYEVLAPGGEGRLPAERRLAAGDLDVLATGDGDLVLLHGPSGCRVVPFDLDLQVETLRSRTYRLLRDLSPVDELPLPLLVGSLHAAIARRLQGEVRALPRIVLEDRLVLGRRAWSVPRRALPVQEAVEDDGAYFRRVDAWRCGHRLPVRVFLSLLRALDRSEVPAEARQGLQDDDRKPQYVSFHDPFLVRLLARLLQRAPGLVVFEEALPAADDLITLDGNPRVTEWVLQWTT